MGLLPAAPVGPVVEIGAGELNREADGDPEDGKTRVLVVRAALAVAWAAASVVILRSPKQ